VSLRSTRVADLIRAELSQIILRRLRDPRVKLTNVSGVDVSPDLKHAVVQISVVGEEGQRLESLEALRHARGFLRSQLARKLHNMKTVPELRFELDRGAEYSQRISDLLENPDEHGN
jgi:ribosome-binding factor A